jgi:hypothetical protein
MSRQGSGTSNAPVATTSGGASARSRRTLGGVSAYDWQHLEDEHGFLTDQPIDEHEPLLEAIPAEEFEAAWREAVQRRAGTN